MPRYIPVFFALVWLGQAGGTLYAQAPARSAPESLGRQASAAGGRIRGIVHDDLGQRIGGVNIIAMGTTLAAARTDSTGRFDIALPPGEYILRANRDGYTSTYREPVRVQTSVALERNITLLRQGPGSVDAASLLALPPDSDDHSHSEAAWRLRHLTRTVLRDAAPTGTVGDRGVTGDDGQAGSAAGDALSSSAALAAALVSRTDFSGQVNFLTSSTLSQHQAFANQSDWARGIAYVAVGAPVGTGGDWRVRGAMTAGDLSSWALVGEYDAHESATHVIRAGMSFSSQDLVAAEPVTLTPATIGSRTVGGIYGSDRWRVTNAFELEGGLRLDRYDYVASPALASEYAGTRARISDGTALVVRVGNRQIAPGADEFLPPSTTGPWLPPQRTFSSLVAGAPMRVEEVFDYELGVDQAFGANGSRTLSVRRFMQSTHNQITTLFGLDSRSAVGHYYISTPGDVDVDGWTVGLGGRLLPFVSGRVDYSVADGDWTANRLTRAVHYLAPSTVRRGDERMQDVTSALSAYIPHTSTQLNVTYRINSAFAGPTRSDRLPGLAGRFDIEVRQELPYQPIRGGRLELVLAARNLMRDRVDGASIYDELLTVSPPLRLLGGIQVRF